MTTELIKKSLELYLTTVTDETERVQVQQSIDECLEQIDCSDDDQICLVSPLSLLDLLNNSTYNIYGKLKRSNDTVTFEQYRDSVNRHLTLDLTDRCLKIGYYFVRDLWSDNERYGSNNPDGTFKTK